jgi:hypothetical protein
MGLIRRAKHSVGPRTDHHIRARAYVYCANRHKSR